MLDKNNPIEGIVCFGSALIRVNPDFVSLTFGLSFLDKKPKKAFGKTKENSQKLNKLLQSWDCVESRSSNLTLSKETEHIDGKWQHIGYKASIQTNVVIRDLSKVEEIITSAIEIGAYEINAFNFGTSSLKEHRAEARRNAIAAAIDKAQNYCMAADVKLGEILGIEDVNPDFTSPYRESHLGSLIEEEQDEEAEAIDPGAIPVNGAVRVTFEIN